MEKKGLQYGVVRMTTAEAIPSLQLKELQRHVAHYAYLLAQMQWELDIDPSAEMMSLSVRRVNMANLGHEATAILRYENVDDINSHDIRKWSAAAIDVLDPRKGDVVIDAGGPQIILAQKSCIPAPSQVPSKECDETVMPQKPKKQRHRFRDILEEAS